MLTLIILLFAVVFEVLGTICMKLSDGFSVLWASLLMFFLYITSFILFVYCIKRMELSIAYAIWTALGMLAISIIGIIFFEEQFSLFKGICLGFISVGVVGLSLEVNANN